jgi:hypothetical protein
MSSAASRRPAWAMALSRPNSTCAFVVSVSPAPRRQGPRPSPAWPRPGRTRHRGRRASPMCRYGHGRVRRATNAQRERRRLNAESRTHHLPAFGATRASSFRRVSWDAVPANRRQADAVLCAGRCMCRSMPSSVRSAAGASRRGPRPVDGARRAGELRWCGVGEGVGAAWRRRPSRGCRGRGVRRRSARSPVSAPTRRGPSRE